MVAIFGDLSCVLVYIDNIIVVSANPQDHLRDLMTVIDRCNQVKLRLNARKCVLARRTITLLGFQVTPQGYARIFRH